MAETFIGARNPRSVPYDPPKRRITFWPTEAGEREAVEQATEAAGLGRGVAGSLMLREDPEYAKRVEEVVSPVRRQFAAGREAAGLAVSMAAPVPARFKVPSAFPLARNPLVTGEYVNPGGAISMNQTMTDALHPARMTLESTVDRVMSARYGGRGTKYFGATGELASRSTPQYPALHKLSEATDALRAESFLAEPTKTPTSWVTGKDLMGANKPAGIGRPATVAAYDAYAQTMRNLFKDPRSREEIGVALRSGGSNSPIFKLYEETRAGLQKTRKELTAFQEKAAAKTFHESLVNVSKNFEADVRASKKLANELRVKPVKSTSSVKPGELFPKVVLPWLKEKATHPIRTVASAISFPKNHPVKALVAGALTGSAVYGAAELRSYLKDTELSAATDETKKELNEIHDKYLKFTSDDTVKSQMSDANALKKSLIGLRTVALSEIGRFPDRAPAVRQRIEQYLERVKDSPAMAKLVTDAELGYRAFSQTEDYEKEFRERYRDIPSQATGLDYFSGF